MNKVLSSLFILLLALSAPLVQADSIDYAPENRKACTIVARTSSSLSGKREVHPAFTLDAYSALDCFLTAVDYLKRLGLNDFRVESGMYLGTYISGFPMKSPISVYWEYNDGYFDDSNGIVNAKTDPELFEHHGLDFLGDRRYW